MNPLISVVVPVYNCEKYLDECVTSLLDQSCADFELLLIDDGSSDSSGRKCDGYVELDKRVRVFHKSNGGVSSARNLGILNAAGEWLMFVDSDDYVSKRFIADAVDQIHKVTDPDSIIFLGYHKVENGRCNSMLLEEAYFDSARKGEAMKYLHIDRDALGYICSKILNINLIMKHRIQFNEQVALSEDMLFTLNCLKHCNHVYTIPSCNYYYRIDNTGSLSKKRIDYLMGQYVIEQTNRLLEEIIDNREVFSLFERAYLKSSFYLLVNLLSPENSKYSRTFILREIDGYKRRENIRMLELTSKSYVFLYWVLLHFPSGWIYLIYRLYFKLKIIRAKTK